MNADGPLFVSGDGLSLASEFAAMVKSGVGTVRVAFNWAAAQPYASWAEVPLDQVSQFVDADGVPTDFSAIDEIVSLASLYNLKLLPVVMYAPSWDADLIPIGVPLPAGGGRTCRGGGGAPTAPGAWP